MSAVLDRRGGPALEQLAQLVRVGHRQRDGRKAALPEQRGAAVDIDAGRGEL